MVRIPKKYAEQYNIFPGDKIAFSPQKQRTDFFADKLMVYEDMFELCLDLQQPTQALAYAELVKSRTLADLLAMQIDLGANRPIYAEQPWAAALRHLRQARDQVVEAWEEPDEMHLRGGRLRSARRHPNLSHRPCR